MSMQLIRQTFRSLTKAPAFSAASVLTMALGIAATTALFSVVYSVLLKPLAFPDAGHVVAIRTAWAAKDQSTPRITGGDFMALRSSAGYFSAISRYAAGEIGVRIDDHARFARTFLTAGTFFRVLGVKPLAGRLPDAHDAGQASVLTDSFARANFGEAGTALGKSVVVDNRPYVVIGIVSNTLAYPEKGELWITGPNDPENQNRTAFNYYAIGRLRPDVTLAKAQSELNVFASRMAAAHPDSNVGKTFKIVSLQEQLGAPVRQTLLFLFAAAGLLLLISCANVANLMLARAAVRTREIAVRVFDKKDFDPKLDPIVRVEARRLRKVLLDYYENDGASDPVVLSVATRGYTLRFTNAESEPVEDEVKRVAVLPFSNMTNNPTNEPFCNGVTQELILFLIPL